MKIDSFSLSSLNSQLSRTEHTDSTSAGTSFRKRDAQDEARLALDHVRIRALESEVTKLPEIRLERVQELREKIQSGAYHVSNEQIADAIVSELFD